MANGRLGTWNLSAGINQAIYVCNKKVLSLLVFGKFADTLEVHEVSFKKYCSNNFRGLLRTPCMSMRKRI